MSIITFIGSSGCGVKTATNYLLKSGYKIMHARSPELTREFVDNTKRLVITNCVDMLDLGRVKNAGGLVVRITRPGHPILYCPQYNVSLYNNGSDLGQFHKQIDIDVLCEDIGLYK